MSEKMQENDGASSVPVAPRSRSGLYWYITPLVLCPILMLVAAIYIVPGNWLAEHSGNAFLVTLGYGAQLRNMDCQIVIYGDSTAMVGLSPALIRQRTGLSTCNIAETEGMTMLNDTMVLDQYLQHNARPRFIVFMYSPEGMDPQSQRKSPEVTTFEAVTYRFRQPDKLKAFLTLMRYPEDVFTWAEHGMRMSLNGIFMQPLPPETRLLRAKTLGQTSFQGAPLQSCFYWSRATPPDRAWVQSLRARYGRGGTTVLVDSMLLPECDGDLGYFRGKLAGVIDNRIDVLPVEDYYSGGRHVNPAGTIPLSNMVADQILSRLSAARITGAH